MNTPQHRRLFQGRADNYDYWVAKNLNPVLWYKHQEPSGSVMLNSGSLSALTPLPYPLPPTNPPVTPPQPTPPLGTDMNMEAVGVAAWSPSQSALSKQVTNPHSGTQLLRVTATASAGARSPQAFQTLLTIGRVYRVTGWARSDGTQIPTIFTGSDAWTGTNSTNWQPIDVIVTAAGTGLALYFPITGPVGTEYCEFDDLTLTEYLPAYNLLKDGHMEAVNVGAWTAGSSATLTKSTTTPHGGTYCLRVARNGVNNPYASQVSVVAGRMYHITGYVRGDGTAVPYIYSGANVGFPGIDCFSEMY